MRTGIAVSVTPEDRRRLEEVAQDRNSPQKHAARARALLATADGLGTAEIMRRSGLSKPAVWRWQERFMREGVDGLLRDKTRKPGKAPLPAETVAKVVELTLGDPPGETTHWTVRAMAKTVGIGAVSVQRIWKAHGLTPHRMRAFKLSRDPRFLERFTDVVGLYVDPPAHAVVLSVDEKSQIQALDRTQPGLPLKKGRCGTMTHDYKRNGTTTLFAALQVLNGKVIGECHGRHRHQEWRKFLRRLDAEFPPELKLHLVMDNYGTHKEPHVQAWLRKHPRFVCHFVPTSSSWLNLVERWFRELTEKAIRRGSFVSVPDLKQAIAAFMQAWNKNPKPFIWSATVEDIIKKIDRARVKMEQIKPGSTQPRGKKKELNL